MTNYSGQSTTTQPKVRQPRLIVAYKDLANRPQKSIRSEAISYHIHGLLPADNWKRAIFCLSSYYWHGDEHRSVPAMQHDDDARIKAIMDVFYRSQPSLKLNDDQLTKVFTEIVKSCTSRKITNQYSFERKRKAHETPDQFKKRKQQAGNIRRYQEAFERIVRVYHQMSEKLGKPPSITSLSKKAKCGLGTARKVIKTLAEVAADKRLTLIPKAVKHLSEGVSDVSKRLQVHGLQDFKSPSSIINFISTISKDQKYKILEKKVISFLIKKQSDLQTWKTSCIQALPPSIIQIIPLISLGNFCPLPIQPAVNWVPDGKDYPDEDEWVWQQAQVAPRLSGKASLTELYYGCGNEI